MIEYDPGSWGFWFAFSLKGSVFPKSFCIAGPCATICCILHYVLREYTDLLASEAVVSALGASLLGGFTTILGFLIVFRSQTAYSRWWEGGTLLQQIRGEWFNAYSCLLAFANPAPDMQQSVYAFEHKLVRLFSLLYASALEQVTTIEDANFELIDLEGFELESLAALKTAHDKCEVVLQWIQKTIVQSSNGDVVKIAPPILSRVYNQLGNGIVGLNNARKITDFPIPFPLAQMVVFMLVCHWLVTVMTCVVYIESPIMAGFICYLVVFSFWTINYISLELEMPFGDDANDLPLFEMQRDFNQSLKDLMKPVFMKPPEYDLGANVPLLRTSEIQTEKYIDLLISGGTLSRGVTPDEICLEKTAEHGVAQGSDVDKIVLEQIAEPPTFCVDVPPVETLEATESDECSMSSPRGHSAGTACPRRPGRPPDPPASDKQSGGKQAACGEQAPNSVNLAQNGRPGGELFSDRQSSHLVEDTGPKGDSGPGVPYKPRG